VLPGFGSRYDTHMPLRNLLTLFLAAVISLACYQRAARNRFVGTLAEAMNLIDDHYVDPVDDRQLFEGAMIGMLDRLDPYSSYTNPKDYKRFKESLDQLFYGIGIMVEINPDTKRLTVMNPLPDSPAQKAGIKPGDTILKIGERDTKDMPLEESVTYMRGAEGTAVTITVQSSDGSEPRELTLKRAKIPIESVRGDTRTPEGAWDFHLEEDRRLGLIRVGSFGEQTIEEFQKALESFTQPGSEVEGLIIDLRSNPGGLLNAAKDMCDMFLDDGVIVTTRGRGGVTTSTYSAEPGVLLKRDVPIVMLVDRYSASASEIVSACLQDYGRAVICGERTWGKGTVQNVAELEGGRSAMRLTTATYWRPSEKNIHKKKDAKDEDDWGVRPDDGMLVELTDEQREKVAIQRNEKDFAAYRRKPKQEQSQPAPKPKPEPESSAPPTPQVQEDPASKPSADEPFDDPQMRRAVDHLQQRLKAPSQPKAA
jgi:carboxyl-terminal processing protease